MINGEEQEISINKIIPSLKNLEGEMIQKILILINLKKYQIIGMRNEISIQNHIMMKI